MTEIQTDKEKTCIQSYRYTDIETKKHTNKETKGQTDKQARDGSKKKTFKIERRHARKVLNKKYT